MKIEIIISRFEKKGYKVTRSFTGCIWVKQPNGFSKVFYSYNEAYQHYFN